jgi:predicted RNase H-like HicB family nuclease
MARVLITLNLPAKIKKKANVYVSSCDVLDVHTQGRSEREAEQNLVEAVKLFLISCFERGTLDAALKDCGFQPIKKSARPIKEGKFITVPIPFQTKGTCLSECHV